LRKKLLLPAALVALAWAIVASLTGGIDTRAFGMVIRARGAFRPLTIGLALLVGHVLLHRDQFMRGSDRVGALLARGAQPIAIVLALLLGVHAVWFGAFAAGGSDSYGYVSQAYGWARGELPEPIPIPFGLPFPSSDLIQTPLGYSVGQRPHTMAPIYAPGLPLLMALGILVAGSYGPFAVTPICAVLLVWFTFALGRRVAGPTAGLAAAVVVAVAPVVVFQSLWPMSDVPAGALWTAALAASLGSSRRHAVAAGACTAIGLLIRPNLLPLVAVPLFAVATSATGRERRIRLSLFALPVAPVPILVAALNTAWHGSPANLGYGAARELYRPENIWPNVKLYAVWFWQSESPWALVGLLALLPSAWRRADRRALAVSLLMMIAAFLCYVAYTPFEVWWYLRFLLPAAGATAAVIATGLVTLARATRSPFGRMAAVATLWMLVTTAISFAWSAGVFGRLRAGERRYVDIGEFVAQALPSNAALLSGQHSGSLRFYGGRMTLRFDFMDKEWASRAAAEIERAGFHPYAMLDDFELPQFRWQFGLAPDSPLPWPVVARMRDLGGMTIWDLASESHPREPLALEPGSQHLTAAQALPLRVR
jgi:4-amino-4-deoxy-L-arabinose transferase-like glycosyltransferase